MKENYYLSIITFMEKTWKKEKCKRQRSLFHYFFRITFPRNGIETETKYLISQFTSPMKRKSQKTQDSIMKKRNPDYFGKSDNWK